MAGIEAMAVCVIGQELDHTTFGNTSPAAGVYDPAELGLECLQTCHLPAHLRKLASRDSICSGTGKLWRSRQIQKSADVGQREAQLPRMPDERQTLRIGPAIEPLIAP